MCSSDLSGEADYREVDVSRYPVEPGTGVLIHGGSGGGWGDPLERDAERVRWDVIEEFVSRESARKDYGVVLRDDLSVDTAATAGLREQMAVSRGKAAQPTV